jgi:hypothetical protein
MPKPSASATFVFLIALLWAHPTGAAEPLQGETAVTDSLQLMRARFPSPEDIKEIRDRGRRVKDYRSHYPRFSLGLGLGMRGHEMGAANKSFQRLDDSIGIQSKRTFASLLPAQSFILQMHIMPVWTLDWEWAACSQNGVDRVGVHSLFGLLNGRSNQVSLGFGYLIQYLELKRDYNISWDGGVLKNIHVYSGAQPAWDLVLRFDHHSPRPWNPTGLFLDFHYVLASDVVADVNASSTGSVPVTLPMRGWQLSTGLMLCL